MIRLKQSAESAQLVQGILYSVNFLLLLLWLGIGKLERRFCNKTMRYLLKLAVGTICSALLVAYLIFFDLSWLAMTALILLALLPGMLQNVPYLEYRTVQADLVTPTVAILSWFAHAAQLLLLGLVLSSNLWFIGAAVIGSAAFINIYIELSIKPALYHLASANHFTSLATGFTRPEEFAFIISVVFTGLLFFPGPYLLENFGQTVEAFVVRNGGYALYAMAALLAAVTAVCSRGGKAPDEVRLIAGIYRGYLRLLTVFGLLAVCGWLLRYLNALRLRNALSITSIFGHNLAELIAQVWLATTTLVLLALLSLAPPIAYCVLGGWKEEC